MMKSKDLWWCFCLLSSCLTTSPLDAGVFTQAAEFAARLVGKRAGPEVTESIASRAIRNRERALGSVSGRSLMNGSTVEATLVRQGQRADILARGGKGAERVIAHPRGLAIWQTHGDQGVLALIRHGVIAEPVIESFGPPAVRALNVVSPQNGRRIAMMIQDGSLDRMGRTAELFEVVAKHGDRAMDFVWRHKGALAVTAVLAAFLADPEPFLNGTKDLAGNVASVAIRPVAEVPGKIVENALYHTNETVLLLLAITLGFVLRGWLRSRRSTAVMTEEMSLTDRTVIS